jgi:hypothetical protein
MLTDFYKDRMFYTTLPHCQSLVCLISFVSDFVLKLSVGIFWMKGKSSSSTRMMSNIKRKKEVRCALKGFPLLICSPSLLHVSVHDFLVPLCAPHAAG